MSVLTSVSTGKRLCVVLALVSYNIWAGSYQAQPCTDFTLKPEDVASVSNPHTKTLSYTFRASCGAQ